MPDFVRVQQVIVENGTIAFDRYKSEPTTNKMDDPHLFLALLHLIITLFSLIH